MMDKAHRRPEGTAGRKFRAHQDELQSYVLLQHKVVTMQRSDGSETVKEQVLITSKGLTRLLSIFPCTKQRIA